MFITSSAKIFICIVVTSFILSKCTTLQRPSIIHIPLDPSFVKNYRNDSLISNDSIGITQNEGVILEKRKQGYIIKENYSVKKGKMTKVFIYEKPSKKSAMIDSALLSKMSNDDMHLYLIELNSLDIANTVNIALLDETSFEELAVKYSKGPNAEGGGNLGFINKNSLSPDFSKVLDTLKLNHVSSLIEFNNKFYFIKRTE